MDYGYPFASVNTIEGQSQSPLLVLVDDHTKGYSSSYQIPDKIALLLSRGADCHVHDLHRNTCLHLVLCYDSNEPGGRRYRKFQNIVVPGFDGELKDILMLLITAGADVYKRNDHGNSPSDVAWYWGHGREWCEALRECEYDPEEVDAASSEDSCWSSGADYKREALHRPLLKFDEYLEIRKSRLMVEEVSDDETDDDCIFSKADTEVWFEDATWEPSDPCINKGGCRTGNQHWQENRRPDELVENTEDELMLQRERTGSRERETSKPKLD